MNCEEFLQIMHQCLDLRQSLDGHNGIRRHAQQCESCRAQLEAWQKIASVMPPATLASVPGENRRSPLGTAVVTAAVLAATVMVVVFAIGGDDSQRAAAVTTVESGEGHAEEAALARSSPALDPTLWWHNVQDHDWVGQTMPTVKSVREGVAPIGRSLMRAVTILTIGGRDQTS